MTKLAEAAIWTQWMHSIHVVSVGPIMSNFSRFEIPESF